MTTLFSDNFSTPFAPSTPGSPYSYVPFPYPSDDGVASQSNNTLTIDSSVYTRSTPTDNDDHKYLALTNETFNAPNSGYLIGEILFKSLQTNLDDLPSSLMAPPGTINGIVDPNIDPRPSCGSFNFISDNYQFAMDFIVTNKTIYVLYERLPYGRTEWGGPGPNYTAFMQLFAVANRASTDEYALLQFAYNKRKNLFYFLVNNEVKIALTNLGAMVPDSRYTVQENTIPGEPPSPQFIINPTGFSIGFGNLTLFNTTSPRNPYRLSNPSLIDLSLGGYFPYVDPNGTYPNGTPLPMENILSYAAAGDTTCFGQGNIISVRNLRVYISNSLPHENIPPVIRRKCRCCKCRHKC